MMDNSSSLLIEAISVQTPLHEGFFVKISLPVGEYGVLLSDEIRPAVELVTCISFSLMPGLTC